MLTESEGYDIKGKWVKVSPLYPNNRTIVFVLTHTGEIHLALTERLSVEEYIFFLFHTSGEKVRLTQNEISHFAPITISLPTPEESKTNDRESN